MLDAEVGVLDTVRGTGYRQTGDSSLGVTGGEEHPTGDNTLENDLPPDQPVVITSFADSNEYNGLPQTENWNRVTALERSRAYRAIRAEVQLPP